MLKPNNRKNLFLQEFFAVLPNLSVDNINVMLNGINTELESRKLTQYAKDGNFLNWSTATEIAWKMANADCDNYDLDEIALRTFLEARMPKGVANKFLDLLGYVSNEASEGCQDERLYTRISSQLAALKKKYPKKRVLKRA